MAEVCERVAEGLVGGEGFAMNTSKFKSDTHQRGVPVIEARTLVRQARRA